MEKKLSYRFEKLKAEYQETTVELWAIDEHRLGLKPIFRRVWTPVGVQPTAEVNWRFHIMSVGMVPCKSWRNIYHIEGFSFSSYFLLLPSSLPS
ncbi:MAG: hypothetical protein AB4063_02570 [Crocosphaera sp.]